MGTISFRRVAPGEARIHDSNGDHVGDVFGLHDPCGAGARYFVIHLSEDPRGPARVHDRSRIREVAERMLATHPFR